MRVLLLPLMLSLCGLFAAAFGPNGVVSGRATAEVGDHLVMVTECFFPRNGEVYELEATAAGEPVFRFAPCRNGEVRIEGDRLFVNDTLYGTLRPGSFVLVDAPDVLVNGDPRRPLPPPQ